MLITYLINTWNRKEALKRHLDLLMQQTHQGWFQVLVCVDGSTDGTQEMLAGMSNTSKYTLQWFDTGNVGQNTAGASRNMGIKAAKGDMIIMADDDCLPHPQLIEKYVANYHYRRIQLGYKSNREEYLSLKLPVAVESGAMQQWYDDWQNNKFGHFQTTNCAMPIWAARTPAKDGSVGFDERFVNYGHEDTEFGRRVHASGYSFVFNQDAVSWHMNASLVQQQDPTQKADDQKITGELLNEINTQPWSAVYPGHQQITGMMSAVELKWLHDTAEGMKNVVELGSWQGRSTHALLAGCTGSVYSVDHWDPAYIGIPGLNEQIITDNRAAFWRNVGSNMRLKVVMLNSGLAAAAFPDKSIDMCFIDADHSYDSVMADIGAWLPKTTKMICGHDYESRFFPGLVKAVHEVFGEVGVIDSIWFKELGNH